MEWWYEDLNAGLSDDKVNALCIAPTEALPGPLD